MKIIDHPIGPKEMMELLTNKSPGQPTVCPIFLDADRLSSQNQRRRDLPVLKSSKHLRPQVKLNFLRLFQALRVCPCLRLWHDLVEDSCYGHKPAAAENQESSNRQPVVTAHVGPDLAKFAH